MPEDQELLERLHALGTAQAVQLRPKLERTPLRLPLTPGPGRR